MAGQHLKSLPSRFGEKEKKIIESYFKVDCNWIHTEEGREKVSHKKKCPDHGFRHKRTPDDYTYRVLFEMFPYYPMEAWGQLFGVSREQIRQLHVRAFNSSYGDEKRKAIYGLVPDMDILEEFADALATKTAITKQNICDFLGIHEAYVNYWMRKEETVKELVQSAEKKRKYNIENPTFLKCYRCGEVKDVSLYHKSQHTVHGYTTTCKDCSVATVKYYYRKRKEEFANETIASEKQCTKCKKVKHRENFHIAKGMTGGLQSMCISCTDKAAQQHPLRKKKFIDAGCDVDKTCTHCKTFKSYWDFFLVTPQPSTNPEYKFATKVCRECVRKAMEVFGLKGSGFHGAFRSKAAKYGSMNPFEVAKDYATGVWDTSRSGKYSGSKKGRPKRNWKWSDFVEAYGEEEE